MKAGRGAGAHRSARLPGARWTWPRPRWCRPRASCIPRRRWCRGPTTPRNPAPRRRRRSWPMPRPNWSARALAYEQAAGSDLAVCRGQRARPPGQQRARAGRPGAHEAAGGQGRDLAPAVRRLRGRRRAWPRANCRPRSEKAGFRAAGRRPSARRRWPPRNRASTQAQAQVEASVANRKQVDIRTRRCRHRRRRGGGRARQPGSRRTAAQLHHHRRPGRWRGHAQERRSRARSFSPARA